MIKCQPIQLPYHHKIGNIKYEGCCPHKTVNYLPLNPNPQSLLKTVEVSCMNRLFRGIGFRNNNGGLEFYSDEYREKHRSSMGENLEMLRKERQSLYEEYKKILSEIKRDKDYISDWNNEYEELVVQQQDVADSMQHLVLQSKSGQFADSEKTRIRQHLNKEENRIKKRMEFLTKAISDYYDNKSRSLLLSAILPELQEKINNMKRESAIANTFTIKQTGLVTFPLIKGIVAKKVNLFYDMFDYLAYIFLLGKYEVEDLPTQCDNIVLNDSHNYIDMLLSCMSYDRIYSYFPHTVLGKIMDKTVHDFIKKGRVKSMSNYYKGYPTLYEYAKTFDEFTPITSKI